MPDAGIGTESGEAGAISDAVALGPSEGVVGEMLVADKIGDPSTGPLKEVVGRPDSVGEVVGPALGIETSGGVGVVGAVTVSRTWLTAPSVWVTGVVTAASVCVTGAVTVPSVSTSGADTVASVWVTGAVTAASVCVIGAVTVPSVWTSGADTVASAWVTGAVTAASVGGTGAVTAASVCVTGAVTVPSVWATGSVTAASDCVTGAVTVPRVWVTGAVTVPSVWTTGDVATETVWVTGAVTAASVGVTGAVTVASVWFTGAVTVPSVGVVGPVVDGVALVIAVAASVADPTAGAGDKTAVVAPLMVDVAPPRAEPTVWVAVVAAPAGAIGAATGGAVVAGWVVEREDALGDDAGAAGVLDGVESVPDVVVTSDPMLEPSFDRALGTADPTRPVTPAESGDDADEVSTPRAEARPEPRSTTRATTAMIPNTRRVSERRVHVRSISPVSCLCSSMCGFIDRHPQQTLRVCPKRSFRPGYQRDNPAGPRQ